MGSGESAGGYFYCLESLSVLRKLTPSIAEMSADKQAMVNKLDETIEMQEFFALEEYLEILATFRLGMETRSCADMTVAEKIKVYRQWFRSKNCAQEGAEP